MRWHPAIGRPLRGTPALEYAAVWLLLVSASLGCVTARNYTDPRQRIIDRTAYTLTHREARVDAGVIGTGLTDAGATIGAAGGVGHGAQISTNLAHAGLGLINATLKYNALDRPWFGLGLEGTLIWTRPDLIWLLPASIQDPIDRINLFIIPLRAIASFPVSKWASLHLGAGYSHAAVLGPVEAESAAFRGGFGARTVFVEPTAHLYLVDRVALIVGGHVTVGAWALENIQGEVEIEPGVIAGVRSSEWTRLPVAQASRWRIGAEVRFGQRTHAQVFITRNLLRAVGIGPPVLPAVNLYWRI